MREWVLARMGEKNTLVGFILLFFAVLIVRYPDSAIDLLSLLAVAKGIYEIITPDWETSYKNKGE